jgi:hypothetical protein
VAAAPAGRAGGGGPDRCPNAVGQWVDIADIGDLVAVPRRLGNRFPVDWHVEVTIGSADFHTMAGYLSSGQTFSALEHFLRGH